MFGLKLKKWLDECAHLDTAHDAVAACEISTVQHLAVENLNDLRKQTHRIPF